jgi:polyhydroxybutyrate depolymerase
VVLYRIEGGGHGWPGGPQYLQARIIGPIPRHLDATGILLDMVTAGSLFCLRRVYQVTWRFPPG